MIPINTEIPKELKTAIKVIAAKLNKTFKQIVIESLQERVKQENANDK